MKTLYSIILFIVVAVAQLAVPAQMIIGQEHIIKNGTAYKFKTQPVDPADPFKGKYIYLNYEMNSFATTDKDWTRQQDIYVSITNDSLGFAKLLNVSKTKPKQGDFVKAKVDWYDKNYKEVTFTFPFDEFYMNESKAYDAEIAHIEAQSDSIPNNTYALVYVKDGEAVLDNVFINDIPVAEYVE